MYMCRINHLFSHRLVNESSRIAQFGEVFTPPEFVNRLLNLLDSAAWSCPRTVFVEPTCGDGAFVVEVLRRRLAKLKAKSRKAAAAIAVSTLWAIDLQADNVDECRANVLRVVLHHLYPTGISIRRIEKDAGFIAAIAAAIEHHVLVGDGLAFNRARETFLCLSAADQEKSAARQQKALKALLGGRTVASWLASVIQPTTDDLFALVSPDDECQSQSAYQVDRVWTGTKPGIDQ